MQIKEECGVGVGISSYNIQYGGDTKSTRPARNRTTYPPWSACVRKDFGAMNKESCAGGYLFSSLAIWTRGGHEQYHERAKKTEEIHSNGSSSRHNTNDSIPMSRALQRLSTSRLWHFEPSGKDPMSCSIFCRYVSSTYAPPWLGIYAPRQSAIADVNLLNYRLAENLGHCNTRYLPVDCQAKPGKTW